MPKNRVNIAAESVDADTTYTISQVNQGIAAALKAGFPNAFWVTGEIQGYDRDASKASTRRWGQTYFELVEKESGADSVKAGIKAILWGDARQAVQEKLRETSAKLALQDGLKVRFLCEVDFWWPRASLQLKVVDVDPNFTLGDMERARQELLRMLQDKGLLDKNKSLPFPLVPLRIGLITSDGSAAYHDFTDELRRSGYSFQVHLWDARMQGDETEASVCRGIDVLSAHDDVDVIVIVRGGGSRSDLIWFDKEKIALAVADCPKPVVTGIGHEIDLSVADLVAYHFQKTPTAVAQFLLEKVRVFESSLEEEGSRIAALTREMLSDENRRLGEAVKIWQYAATRMTDIFRAALNETANGILSGVRSHVQLEEARLSQAPEQLRRVMQDIFRRHRERLEGFQREAQLKDPRKLLERGYSILSMGGKIVKSVEQVEPGREVEAQLRDGILKTKVLSKSKS